MFICNMQINSLLVCCLNVVFFIFQKTPAFTDYLCTVTDYL